MGNEMSTEIKVIEELVWSEIRRQAGMVIPDVVAQIRTPIGMQVQALVRGNIATQILIQGRP